MMAEQKHLINPKMWQLGQAALSIGGGAAVSGFEHGGVPGTIVTGMVLYATACGIQHVAKIMTSNDTTAITDLVPDVEIDETLDQSPIAKIKRIAGIKDQQQGKPKEERETGVVFTRKKNDSFEYEEDSEFPAKFTLDLVLDRIKKYNRQNKLYLGTSCQGDIALNVADVYHILHVAKSGRGKSNDLRFIMMQLVQICECYCINPMGNNKKRLKSDDPRKYEIWKPIYESLENRHVVKEAAEIEKLLKHVAKIVKYRVAHEEEDNTWAPIFLFIDEMKMVKDLYPDLEEPLSTIAMSGRQTWVFLFGASQTAYVGDIGLKTGTQTQFQTILYAGGSDKSMNKLTQGQITNEVEEKLRANKGLRALFIEGEEKFTWMRTPLTTNEAVFEFFNLEFNLEDWENNVPLEKNSVSSYLEEDETDSENLQDEDFEQLETENPVDDDIMWAFETLRAKGILRANVNQIVTMIKEAYPDSMITRNTDEPRIKELAREYGFEIFKGPGGRREAK